MCQNTEINLQKVKWHMEPWLLISYKLGTKKVSVLKVSANGCIKLEVNIIGLRENCADNASGEFLQSFKTTESNVIFPLSNSIILKQNLPYLVWLKIIMSTQLSN